MTQRTFKYYIAGNWKMNKTATEAAEFARELVAEVGNQSEVHVTVCPPFTALASVGPVLANSTIHLGAQNLFPDTNGAYTGEVSPGMLRDLYVGYVILGHSERRQVMGEKNDFINRKVLSALKSHIRPILCVGETLEERESAKTLEVIQSQLKGCLKDVSKEDAERLIIAYEPVWAIGTGKNATPEQAQEVHAAIRGFLSTLYNSTIARKIPLLYGGSLKPENAESLLTQRDVDGGLIGGAALEIRSFARIIEIAASLCQQSNADSTA